MANPLTGKVALVTGGSSGLGQASAQRLANLGVAVALAARNADALAETVKAIEKAGGQAMAIPTDVTLADQVRGCIESTIGRFGRLDILLNAAGLSMRAYFEGTDLAAMERVMRVNFFGTLYATHYALAEVKKTKGSLVALSSLTGKRGIPSYALYGASKFAVQGLYEALRLELAPDGVHVGIVSPAFVDTPLRVNVLGPDGQPYPEPPPPPFRIWPIEKCVDRIIQLIVKRRKEALLPAFAGPLLTVDHLLGRWLGDRLLKRKFPPTQPRP